MLSTVLQELENLVDVQKLLRPTQAETLRCSINLKVNSGSHMLVTWFESTSVSPKVKDDLILEVGFGISAGPRSVCMHSANSVPFCIEKPQLVVNAEALIVPRGSKGKTC